MLCDHGFQRHRHISCPKLSQEAVKGIPRNIAQHQHFVLEWHRAALSRLSRPRQLCQCAYGSPRLLRLYHPDAEAILDFSGGI